MHAMPVMICVLCLMAISYRYYSAFLAAKVAALDETRETPAVKLNDGHNYHPTNKWVLFGHHFAAISGAGPLIGPVLAAQFGYLPGLLWIVIGVCLGGAVQDFLVLAASMRRGGRSLAQIAFSDIGKVAGTAAMIAILFIIVIALAGLGKVVVKALGGEAVKYPAGSVIQTYLSEFDNLEYRLANGSYNYRVPSDAELKWGDGRVMKFTSPFTLHAPQKLPLVIIGPHRLSQLTLSSETVRLMPGSSWGTFTIACTIPIALLVGLWMYKIRPGHVVEASLVGAVLTLAATFIGGFVPGSPIERWFNLRDTTVVWAMAVYGFVASVLPVWILLCPRDYLSSFLKIGTIILLVAGTIVANPKLEAPAYNSIFASGGPTVAGKIFPFLFITIMCGAISGFHALVSSGTTPKMIKNEKDARTIGYGAMLIEGLVGVVAMIAAATLPVGNYYAMNTDLAKVPQFQEKFVQIGAHVDSLPVIESQVHESLRGRTGGAVTLAVGMANIFDNAAKNISSASEHTVQKLMKYWYHFAIMFEALFILTTIDTGTRIGRFLLQEVGGKMIHPKLGQTDWWPGAIVSTALIVAGWMYFILYSKDFAAIWAMFGIANQMLAVIALAIVSAYLSNIGKARYLWVTVLPMIFVATTTSTAAVTMLSGQIDTFRTQVGLGAARNTATLVSSIITGGLIAAMLTSTAIVVVAAAVKIYSTVDRGEESGAIPAAAAD